LASSCRSGAAALAVAAAALLAPVARAQGTGPLVLSGRVVLVKGADTTGLVGQRVVAHRVATAIQGPIDSLASGAGGAFRFAVPHPDTAAMYVVSTLYHGIGYFSAPVSTQDSTASPAMLLAVYDTTTTGAPLVVSVRHVVVSAPDQDGSRDVLDIAQVGNPGAATLVGAREGATTWWMRLPRGVESFQVGEGDVPSSAVRQAGDSVLVSAPFPPGEKNVVVTYIAPKQLTTLRVPVDQPTQRLELLVEDSLATASGPRLVTATPLDIQGRTFRRFTAVHLGAGDEATVSFRQRGAGRRLEWVAIVLSALLLAGGGYLAARRRGAPAVAAAPAAPARGASAADDDALVRQLVALDERYAGRQGQTAPADWAAYQATRAALKAELAGRLARR
jgi:hypothetical protein